VSDYPYLEDFLNHYTGKRASQAVRDDLTNLLIRVHDSLDATTGVRSQDGIPGYQVLSHTGGTFPAATSPPTGPVYIDVATPFTNVIDSFTQSYQHPDGQSPLVPPVTARFTYTLNPHGNDDGTVRIYGWDSAGNPTAPGADETFRFSFTGQILIPQ